MTAPFIFWGKSEGEGPRLRYLSVLEHSLNVAAAAESWMENRPSLWHRWADLLGLAIDQKGLSAARNIALHFILLHDLGKYDHRFQGKHAPLFERLNGTQIPPTPGSFDHGAKGLHFFSRFRVGKGLLKANKIEWFPFMRATTSHHGRYTELKIIHQAAEKIQDSQMNPDLRKSFGFERDRAIAEHIRNAETLYPLPDFEPFTKTTVDALVFLAGICSVSDWLGSDSRFFPCRPVSDVTVCDWIQEDQKSAARRLLEANHLLGRYCGNPEMILPRIFPGRNKVVLRPLQEAAMNMDLSRAPQLVVIEAPMGEGKTEAAMILADRLLAAGSVEKLYFALPTMATANAMYGRMSAMMAEHRFFDEGSSLVLAHGKRNLRESFRKHILVSRQRENYRDDGNPPARMMCNRFFAQSHKRSLLANVGVGTVDQIMSAVLGGRHHWIKLFALADSVVIIDEVHAYDAYMRKILRRLIEWLDALGAHVILLSATLPHSIRRELAGESLSSADGSRDYPLIMHTRVSNNSPPLFMPCKASASAKKTVFFRMTSDSNEIIDRLLRNAQAGAQCCVVLNTVAKAQELFGILRGSERVGGIELLLFHSRFMLKDRGELEEAVLTRFGKSGDRSSGRILIATQVVEQSLDVDFDFMVSEIAPIDLLLQRAGRLHRFPWNSAHRRATLWEAPQLMVFMPCQTISELLDDPKENPAARSVYDAAILYRTALLFQEERVELTVRIPVDIRPLVDRVYDREGLAIPAEDADRHAQSWGEWETMAYEQRTRGAGVLQPPPNAKGGKLGKQTAPDFKSNEEMECPEMAEALQSASTRLSSPSQTLVFVNDAWLLGREDFTDDAEAYMRFLENVELHSVTVLQDMIRGVDTHAYRLDTNLTTPDEWKNTVKQFEKELPAWKGYTFLPLIPGEKVARYEFNGPIVLEYSASLGLQIEHLSREKRSFFRLQEGLLNDTEGEDSEDGPQGSSGKTARSAKPPAPEEDLKRKIRSNPLKDRISYLHVGRARLDVDDSGLVMTSNEGEAFRQIPVASLTVILLEPGSTVTHEAVKLCALHKCLLIWVGEGGVRLYSAGYSDFSSSEKLLHQANMYHDPVQRLTVVRRMFEIRFQRPCPMNKRS
jgi:CRISPR-associated endonuclease/helicase Cas3